jgi:hypothetical protein
MKIFSNKKIILFLSLFLLVFFVTKTASAVWNGTFYNPGDTLEPECAPTDVDCDVLVPFSSQAALFNYFFGKEAGNVMTGTNNTAVGFRAGKFITDGSTPNITSGSSLYLGANTKALADGDTNEIVIGYNATGLGSNSVVLGNSSIVTTALRGNVGIGTTTPTSKLQVSGATPAFTLTNTSLVTQDWQFRNGAINPASRIFDIYDATAGATRLAITDDGEVRIGSATNEGGAGNSSRLFVYGGANGANIDVMGDGAISDQATLELEGSDYSTFTNSARLQYYGPNGVGTTLGFGNQRLGILGFNNTDTAIIATQGNATPIIFGIDDIERMRLDGDGDLGIGTINPTAKLAIDTTSVPTGGELLVGDGTFTGGTTGWVLGSDVAYGANSVTSTYAGGDPSLSTTFSTVAGNTYLLTFEISSANAAMNFYFENNTLSNDWNTFITKSGPFSNGTIKIAFETNFTGVETIHFDDENYRIGDVWTLDNVSIKLISSPGQSLAVNGFDGFNWLSLGGDILSNTALGSSALSLNTTGDRNTATGYSSLYNNTTGSRNTAIGSLALYSNLSGNTNTATGFQALFSNNTGISNNAFGFNALYNNTTGLYNNAFGEGALYSNISGDGNTAFGDHAGYSNSVDLETMTNSTFIGFGTTSTLDGITNSMALGNAAQVTKSNQVVIGNTGVTETLLRGLVGIGITPVYKLDVLATGTGIIARFNSTNATGCTLADGGTITCTSDERMKKNIEDITYGLETIKGLRPVLFNWKYEADTTSKNLGFIAQEVEALVPKLIATDENGMKSLNTTAMVPILTKAIQELDLQITDISNLEKPNTWRDSLLTWFGSVGNGIGEMFAQTFRASDKLCINDTCVTEAQLKILLENSGMTPEPIIIPEPTPEPTPEPVVEPTPEPVTEPTPEPEPVIETTPEPAEEPTPEPTPEPAI